MFDGGERRRLSSAPSARDGDLSNTKEFVVSMYRDREVRVLEAVDSEVAEMTRHMGNGSGLELGIDGIDKARLGMGLAGQIKVVYYLSHHANNLSGLQL